MEKSEAIRRFNEGKQYIETCLEQIASLELNNDKDLRLALMGTFLVNVSYKAHENFCKVTSYVIDGKDGAQQLKAELICLKEKLVQLYDGADRQNLVTIKRISEMIISEIKEVEKWTGDHEQIIQGTNQVANNPIPETDDDKDEGNGDKPITKNEIIKSLEGKEKFVPSKPINLYDVFYDRLVKGKIKNKNDEYHVLGVLRKICDDDKENVELFKRCVESADISNLYNEGKKSYARLFMNDIASLFSEPEKFRKAAAKSFGLKEGTELGAVGGNYKKDYRSLMNGLFDDNADYRNRNNS